MQYTKAELDMLLMLRRKDRTWAYIEAHLRPKLEDPVGSMNIMLSDCAPLFKNERLLEMPLSLNQKGRTVAQAEYDRRFDMYYTRIMSLAALLVSVSAIIVSLAGK